VTVCFAQTAKNGTLLFSFSWHTESTTDILLHDFQKLFVLAEIFPREGVKVFDRGLLKAHSTLAAK